MTRRRLLQGVLVLLVVAAALPVAVAVVPQVVGADHAYVVLSQSMEPTLSRGDVVVVDDAAPTAVEAGDVVTYETGADVPNTHRVVEVVQTDDGVAFRTKGDATEHPDPRLVPGDSLVGTVRFHVPVVGHLLLFAHTRLGAVVFLVVPGVLLVASELWSLFGPARASSEE